MEKAKVIQEEIEEQNIRFSSLYVETKNANIIFLSEGESRLGTLAVALPQRKGMLGPVLSSILLGERNTILARMLAESLAEKLKKITLVSIFIKSVSEREAGQVFMKLINKTLEGREES